MSDISSQRQPAARDINALLNCISHELVHAAHEEPCGLTHNHSFSIKQRNILIGFSKNFSHESLMKSLQSIYQKIAGNQSARQLFDVKGFLDSQFQRSETGLTRVGLFTPKAPTPPTDSPTSTTQENRTQSPELDIEYSEAPASSLSC